ncbi:hypothetical protein K458DRAFT_142351 [Lentithecium fluviatile CBS 122367]|uniref:Uncharacterized protein n=1 Tax=Lentithecium fluviatile CBS 122367 TaxID=1168545 RepID=A0A6G1IIW7_9PLEO|nr:hypothetical protein K458DRAFT_142351 [Lentithecium fluviatile CBS 122367]
MPLQLDSSAAQLLPDIGRGRPQITPSRSDIDGKDHRYPRIRPFGTGRPWTMQKWRHLHRYSYRSFLPTSSPPAGVASNTSLPSLPSQATIEYAILHWELFSPMGRSAPHPPTTPALTAVRATCQIHSSTFTMYTPDRSLRPCIVGAYADGGLAYPVW